MKTKILIVFLALSFIDAYSQVEYTFCSISHTVCGGSDLKYELQYFGSNCNCCSPVPPGIAFLTVYAVHPWCWLPLWQAFDHYSTIPSENAAIFYEAWGGYCGSCV